MNASRTAVLTLFCLGFLFGIAAAQQVATVETTTENPSPPFVGEVTADRVNVRGGPGTNYFILTVANEEDRLLIVEEREGWYRIRPPIGIAAWIRSDLIKAGEEGFGVVKGNRINLRPVPGTERAPMGQATKGARLRIVGEDTLRGWTKVEAPADAECWIFGRYVAYRAELTAEAEDQYWEVTGERREAEGRQAELIEQFETARQREEECNAVSLSTRDYTAVIALYEEIASETGDSVLKMRAKEQVARLLVLQSTVEECQEAMQRYATSLEEAERLYQNRLLTLMRQQQEPKPRYDATGWLCCLGKIWNRPATHELVKGDRRLFLVKSDKINLNIYRDKFVGLRGKMVSAPEGWEEWQIILVDEVEVISNR